MITQNQAIVKLEEILDHKLHPEFSNCTGNAHTCKIDECMLCSVRDCPYNEPLHYHHDGCPACYNHYLSKD